MSLYTQALIDAGFTKHQAAAYTYLVENGPTAASVIARHSGISRTLIYRVLDDLIERGLVVRDDPEGAVSTFSPAHPVKLHEYIEARRQEAERAAESVASVVDGLTSEYNKRLGKPGVRFFEGPEGVEYVLNDSLKTGGEILTYVDTDTVEKFAADVNARYVTKRLKLRIQKRILYFDSPQARAEVSDLPNEFTSGRVMPFKTKALHSVMQIYARSISYVTFGDGHTIGAIIEDEAIHALHANLFENAWVTAMDATALAKRPR